MMQSIEELKSRQAEFEKALEQKEAEKMLIYQVCRTLPLPFSTLPDVPVLPHSQEMIQSKHRQDMLESRMSRMVGVLMQACHSIGLTQLEGDSGSSLLQILDCESPDPFSRLSKRQRLLENSPLSPSLDVSTSLEGGYPKYQVPSRPSPPLFTVLFYTRLAASLHA